MSDLGADSALSPSDTSAPETGAATWPSGPLRARAVINGGGGTVRREGADTLRARLAAAFASAGAEVEILICDGADLIPELERAREDAKEERLDAVLVGGGDGSIGTAAGVLVDSGVPMGVLPLGTLNHFAKDLGMPLDVEAAAAALATAHRRRVDVGEVNGKVFVNNSVIGVYPSMVIDRERRQRGTGLGKWPAMALALWRILTRFRRRRLRVCTEGSARPYRTACLFIGVNEYDMEMLTLRRARGLDGGQLWLFVARHQAPLAFIWFALRVAWRGLEAQGEFERLTASEVLIHTKVSRIPVSTDGEVMRLRGPLRYRIRPGALTVLSPTPAAGEPAPG